MRGNPDSFSEGFGTMRKHRSVSANDSLELILREIRRRTRVVGDSRTGICTQFPRG
jgi:hypothetical protein